MRADRVECVGDRTGRLPKAGWVDSVHASSETVDKLVLPQKADDRAV